MPNSAGTDGSSSIPPEVRELIICRLADAETRLADHVDRQVKGIDRFQRISTGGLAAIVAVLGFVGINSYRGLSDTITTEAKDEVKRAVRSNSFLAEAKWDSIRLVRQGLEPRKRAMDAGEVMDPDADAPETFLSERRLYDIAHLATSEEEGSDAPDDVIVQATEIVGILNGWNDRERWSMLRTAILRSLSTSGLLRNSTRGIAYVSQLARLPTKEAGLLTAVIIEDPKNGEEIRTAAIRGLSEDHDPSVDKSLLAVAQNTDSTSVKLAALGRLKNVGSPGVREVLREFTLSSLGSSIDDDELSLRMELLLGYLASEDSSSGRFPTGFAAALRIAQDRGLRFVRRDDGSVRLMSIRPIREVASFDQLQFDSDPVQFAMGAFLAEKVPERQSRETYGRRVRFLASAYLVGMHEDQTRTCLQIELSKSAALVFDPERGSAPVKLSDTTVYIVPVSRFRPQGGRHDYAIRKLNLDSSGSATLDANVGSLREVVTTQPGELKLKLLRVKLSGEKEDG